MLLLGRDDTSSINSCWGRNDVVCSHSTTTVNPAANICFFHDIAFFSCPSELWEPQSAQGTGQSSALLRLFFFFCDMSQIQTGIKSRSASEVNCLEQVLRRIYFWKRNICIAVWGQFLMN